jgi:hypothetical protein
MITQTDALNTIEFDDYFVILPSLPLWDIEKFTKTFGGAPCRDGFSYCSGTNDRWLGVEEIRDLVRSCVDRGFTVDQPVSVSASGRLTLVRGPEDMVIVKRANTLDKTTKNRAADFVAAKK